MLQNATSAEFETFPSSADDQYRSMKATVSTEVDDLTSGRFVGVEADFQIADGRSISGVYLGATGYITDPNLIKEVLAAREDLEKFKTTVDAWYLDAQNALLEAEIAVQQYILAIEAPTAETAVANA